MLSECTFGEPGIAGEILDRHTVSADLIHDLENTFDDRLALIAGLRERLANEELQALLRLGVGLQRPHGRDPVLLTLDGVHRGARIAQSRAVGNASRQRARSQQVSAGEVVVIPSDLPHRAEALHDTVEFDIFSPPRQDWLDKSDTYLRD